MDDKGIDPEASASNGILSVLDTKHAVEEVELEIKKYSKRKSLRTNAIQVQNIPTLTKTSTNNLQLKKHQDG